MTTQLERLMQELRGVRSDVGLLKRLEYTKGGVLTAHTLQRAYEGGATIELSAGEGDLLIDNDAGDQFISLDEDTGYVGVGTAAPAVSLDVSSSAGGGACTLRVKPTDATSASAILRLSTNNAVASGTSNSHADLQFYDGATMGFRFLAGFGNAAGARYGGFIALEDRDGNHLPLRFYTRDAGDTGQCAVAIPGAQPAGTPASVGIGTTAPAISDGNGLDVNGKIVRIRTTKTPSSASDTGNAGEICWDADYIYVCIAANTWTRVAIATW